MPSYSLSKTGEKVFRRLLCMLPPEFATIVKGLVSYVPGIFNFVASTDSGSAQYCYSRWLQHITFAYDLGFTTWPRAVVELGPGSSLGHGLAAMLCGTEKYYALDVLPHAQEETNNRVLVELCKLFRSRAPIGLEKDGYEHLRPFPRYMLSDEHLDKCMEPARIKCIELALRKAISGEGIGKDGDIEVAYYSPWFGLETLKPHSADMIISTVVLQAVRDPNQAYECCSAWLKPGGFMSHMIDYSNYGMVKKWNGHWAYSPFTWRLMEGNRPYLHNRLPHSHHVELMVRNGFEILSEVKTRDLSGIDRRKLASEFRHLSDDDLTTRGVHVIAMKR